MAALQIGLISIQRRLEIRFGLALPGRTAALGHSSKLRAGDVAGIPQGNCSDITDQVPALRRLAPAADAIEDDEHLAACALDAQHQAGLHAFQR